MQVHNLREASNRLGVSQGAVERWARGKRIRVHSWLKNKPLFTEEAIAEAARELEKYDRPAVKEDIEPIIA